MKIGASMWSVVDHFRRGEIDAMGFVRYAESLGVEGVELLDFFWKDRERELADVIEHMKGSSLEVAAYSISNDFVVENSEERKSVASYIEEQLEVASELGAPVLRVFSGNLKEGLSFDGARGWIVEGMRSVVPVAERYGITLALENHGLLAGRSEQIRGVLDDVGSKFLRANIDTGNFLLVDESPLEAVRNLADRAALVHLKDFKKVKPGTPHSYKSIKGEHFQGTVIGEGEVPLREILKELKAKEYSGYLSIEFEGIGGGKVGLEKSVKNTKAILKRI
ncbi:MAG: sugar phosphate isomerase/epimerase family protein [bacterium]